MASDLTEIPQLSQDALAAAFAGKHALVVGGTAGIGLALAVSLAKRGASVTVVGRRAPAVTPDVTLTHVSKDLSLLRSARELVDELGDLARFQWVVFTNGIITTPERKTNAEGLELDLAVSYLSRFVFLQRALAEKRLSSTARVFIMGYPGNDTSATLDDFNSEQNYSAIPAHMNTVVGNEALVAHLAHECSVYGLNPGIIQTDIRRNYLGSGWMFSIVETLIGWFSWSTADYAEQTLVHVLASPALEGKSGTLISNVRKVMQPNPFLTKDSGANQQRVIEESIKLIERALKQQQQEDK